VHVKDLLGTTGVEIRGIRIPTALIFAGLGVALAIAPVHAQPVAAPDTVETRLPWEPPGAPFIRSWLFVGQFPVRLAYEDDEAPDFLMEHGGEEAIAPSAGMTHTGPDQKKHSWIRSSAQTAAAH
jgi:hypothetical protein